MTTRAASALRVPALAGAALLAAGCATFSPVQTEYDYPAADGVRLSIEGLELRNLAIVSAAEGATGVLVGQAVNSSASAVDVSFAVQGGGPAATATVPASSGDALSDATSTLEVPGVPAPPGATVELVVSTPQAGQNIVTVPVLAHTGYYASLPTPSPAVGIYAESALGTLINLQQPGTMAAEQTFFLTMTEQVSTLVPQIKGGRIELPEVADLSQLVDRERLRQLAYNS